MIKTKDFLFKSIIKVHKLKKEADIELAINPKEIKGFEKELL